MSVVMTGAGHFVEVQAPRSVSEERLDQMLALAAAGIGRLITLQRRALEAHGEKALLL